MGGVPTKKLNLYAALLCGMLATVSLVFMTVGAAHHSSLRQAMAREYEAGNVAWSPSTWTVAADAALKKQFSQPTEVGVEGDPQHTSAFMLGRQFGRDDTTASGSWSGMVVFAFAAWLAYKRKDAMVAVAFFALAVAAGGAAIYGATRKHQLTNAMAREGGGAWTPATWVHDDALKEELTRPTDLSFRDEDHLVSTFALGRAYGRAEAMFVRSLVACGLLLVLFLGAVLVRRSHFKPRGRGTEVAQEAPDRTPAPRQEPLLLLKRPKNARKTGG